MELLFFCIMIVAAVAVGSVLGIITGKSLPVRPKSKTKSMFEMFLD